MSIDNNWGEALRQSAESTGAGEAQFKTRVTGSALPAGAATYAEQAAQTALQTSIDGKIVTNAASGVAGINVHAVNSGIIVSADNSTAAALGAGATFAGIAEDVSRFPEITINLAGAPSVAPGTLTFEFSPDGIHWDVSVPYTLTGPNAFVPLPLRTVLKYFRVKYTNGGTVLTQLRLTTAYHWATSNDLTRVLNQLIDENEPVKNVRAFVGGKSPDGPYTNFPASGVVAAQTTSTPLGISGTYNAAGTPRATEGFVAIAVSLKASHVSASGGLVFQFFADAAGTRLVKESMFTYASAGTGIYRQVPANQGPYVRVKYTNGTTAQTNFELVTQLITSAPPSELSDINELITDATAATVVKSNIVGKKENGIYSSVRLSNSESLKVAITDRPSEVRNRTAIYVSVPRTSLVAGDTLFYTVTTGKILYVTSFVISQLNDANVIGEWRVRDAATVLGAFIMTNKIAGAASASSTTSPSLPEPMKFATNVNFVEVTGDIIVAGFLIGYEE